jgi:putative phosphoribosyl transferase
VQGTERPWARRAAAAAAATAASGERFRDRLDAGQILARHLGEYAGDPSVIVFGLPRGGVPVAYEVARTLGAPLDVFLVRKLGVPGHEELAMGAIASGGVRVLNRSVIGHLRITDEQIEEVAGQEGKLLAQRERQYREGRPPAELAGRTVILVDDGLATGASMRAAVAAARNQGAGRIVVAVPVAARETCDALEEEADQVVCAVTPEPFYAVGLWYDDFSQTTDEEVRTLLARIDRDESDRP